MKIFLSVTGFESGRYPRAGNPTVLTCAKKTIPLLWGGKISERTVYYRLFGSPFLPLKGSPR
jgi:hypothetical protein